MIRKAGTGVSLIANVKFFFSVGRARAGFKNLQFLRRAQITTNLANNLNTFGRSVEAISLYDPALL